MADADDLEFAFEDAGPDPAVLVLGKKKKKKKKAVSSGADDEDADAAPVAIDTLATTATALKQSLKPSSDVSGSKKKNATTSQLEPHADQGDDAREKVSDGPSRDDENIRDPTRRADAQDPDEELVAVLSKKKKKKKPAKSADPEDPSTDISDPSFSTQFAALQVNGNHEEPKVVPDMDDLGPIAPAAKSSKSKKKDKNKHPAHTDNDDQDIDAILAQLDDGKSNSTRFSTADPVAPKSIAVSGTTGPSTAQKKGKKKQAPAQKDDDLDAILAELEEPPSTETPAAPVASKQPISSVEPHALRAGVSDVDLLIAELDGADGDVMGSKTAAAKRKKKGKAKKEAGPADATLNNNDEIDALLAELGEGNPSVPHSTSDPQDQERTKDQVPPTAEDLDIDALLEEADADGVVKVSSAAKKKAAKKKKAKAVTETMSSDVPTETANDSGIVHTVVQQAAALPKKGKKESAAVKRLREHRERLAAEEERLAKVREEEEKRRLEEERLEREREEAILAAKQAKKEAEKAKRARLKAEGKLLSKAEAAKKKKADAFRQQALESGLVPGASLLKPSNTGDSEDQSRTRVIYSKKKRSKAAKQEEESGMVVQEAMQALEELGADQTLARETNVLVETDPATMHEANDPEPTSAVIAEVVPDEWEDADIVDNAAKTPESKEVEVRTTEMDTAQNEVSMSRETGQDDQIDDEEEEDDEDSEDDSSSDDSEDESDDETAVEEFRKLRAKELTEAKSARTPDNLRSPIICILGHVDTGKTKILDRIRRTNVQDGEAGGITQQIGATYFPIDAVKKETTKLEEGKSIDYNVPSLLIIDTPGHESFTNLRSRGSSLCDIAILVIDIMHGLEPQTRESIDLLKLRKTPFVVALNKVDRMYDWTAVPGNCPIRDSLVKQKKHVVDEFRRRAKESQIQLQEIGFNAELYWENTDVRKNISIVPTSAITGEGIPDLLMLLLSLSQKLLVERLMFCPIIEATVLEVKVIEGLGTTIDIVLTGGTIREGDTIFVVGLDGPIQTTIRALLTPHPMKEMRVKGQYLHHKEIRAAQGIKISADGLDKAVAGTQVMVAKDPSNATEIEFIREEVMKDFTTILQDVDKSGMGVYVQASTLGSLEALLEFLRTSKIPVSGINIGPVHKRDVTKASTMLEKRKEFATILAFDVPVEKEAREMADDIGVRIFTADIIYHLFDQFTLYMQQAKENRREQVSNDVVFPCILRILRDKVFHNKDPIIMGVDVVEGILRIGTPLVVRSGTEWLDIGRVVSIEHNMQQVRTSKRGEAVCVKIQSTKTEHIMYGRHFDWQNQLVSKMTRNAINILKEDFRDDLDTEDWRLVVKLKSMLDII